MKFIHNAIVNSRHHQKPIIYDVSYIENQQPKPVIVFLHGFKGFKDWGPFNLVSEFFASQKFVFLKFNLSHNGTTPEAPLDFDDLTAFGENNYLIELDDISSIIDHIFEETFQVPRQELNLDNIFLIGHSRGGGMVIIKAFEEKRVSGIATWASVDSLSPNISASALDEWKKQGVRFIFNGRTKQNMPMKYQFYERFIQNKNRLDIKKAVEGLDKPFIAFHGSDDEALAPSMLKNLNDWNPNIETHLVSGANHTFGGKHPYTTSALPEVLRYVCEETSRFFKRIP